MDWIAQVFDYKVEKKEIPRPAGKPYYKVSASRLLCLHTTEGGTIDGAYSTLAGNHSAPHFIVGDNGIIQCRPIGVQAAALRAPANSDAQIQIEVVGFSKKELWLPLSASLDPLVALLAWVNKNLNVPLVRPNSNWRDDLSDMKGEVFAARNSRRKWAEAGGWPKAAIWQHLECPWQQPSYHWDCGALDFTGLFQRVKALLSK